MTNDTKESFTSLINKILQKHKIYYLQIKTNKARRNLQ